MQVTFYATLRAVVGAKQVEIDLGPDATVLDLAQRIAERWPELAERVLTPEGRLSRQVHILVDGRNSRWLPLGSATPIGPGQKVDVFPPTAGG
jgi:molybdopterin synthase sulfur carrier subunit